MYTGRLITEPPPQTLLFCILKQALSKLLRLGLNLQPPRLSLWGGWDYRHVPPHPASSCSQREASSGRPGAGAKARGWGCSHLPGGFLNEDQAYAEDKDQVLGTGLVQVARGWRGFGWGKPLRLESGEGWGQVSSESRYGQCPCLEGAEERVCPRPRSRSLLSTCRALASASVSSSQPPGPCHTPADRWNDGGHLTDRKGELSGLLRLPRESGPVWHVRPLAHGGMPRPAGAEAWSRALTPPWLGVLAMAGAVQPCPALLSPSFHPKWPFL